MRGSRQVGSVRATNARKSTNMRGSALGQHGVRWSGSAGATVPVGLLSVSISAAFVNVGFALVWLRLQQHAFTQRSCIYWLLLVTIAPGGVRWASMVFAGRAVQAPLCPLVSFPSPFQLRL
jgi:hypothetical protein